MEIGRTSEERDVDQNDEQRSARSTPSRTTTDLTRSQSAGKGGCWTCRVRRKKCDEEREGDSCKTCLRLRIKCLGWGPKRPEWMRDKDKVSEYKAGIKEQLTRAGLIRGQPRTAYQMPSKNVVPSQSSLYAGLAGGSGSQPRRSYGDMDHSYRSTYASSSQIHASGVIPVLPTTPQDTTTMSSFLDPTLNDSMFYGSPTIPVMSTPDLSYEGFLGGDLSSLAPLTPSLPATPPLSESTPSPEEYIMYYFNQVRPLQYVFAGNTVTSLLYSMIYAEPRGVLSNALCALASLHSARRRISQGLESPNNIPQRSIPKFFYDQAAYQLMNKKTMGQYSEQDAIAAAYLVSFAVLSGGSTNWLSMLEIACEWLSQTGIHEDQNPKLTLMNMSSAGRFAAKATMWMDILSSVTFLQPPRFLSLYRRLFKSGAGYWGASTGEHFECKMDFLTGCPDGAVLAIAEVAALAHWKATEMRNGCLSIRELVRRGDLIEQELKSHSASGLLDADKAATTQVVDPLLAASSGGMMQGEGPDGTAPPDEVRVLIGKIHRENALLYLHTVVNDAHPGCHEIVNSTTILSNYLQKLPPTDFDRAIMFPLCLTAVMTDDPALRDQISHRCAAHNDEYVGNMYQARTLMGAVWSRRQQAMNMQRRSVPVDWRECLRDRWSSLLVV
ncbi:hypothetical protein EUX98_g4257 [Antrodiella citrinella]|uniref:Zn(2)-C6 fungal-type domain-containing protein n=1 Tax=Antrodiella citrinella TaxID=2447956 RepID=A0A4S4MUL3_9APHY|nr:hypothetical protein EUX98_g4257 [Antrodiella citrinella]